jgi:hypothetical protein
MELAVLVAIVGVLVLIAAAVAHLAVRRPRSPPACPPEALVAGFWSTPDNSTKSAVVSCPPGAAIAVRAAGYGAPWSQCPWLDVAPEAQRILDGANSVAIPTGPGTEELGLPDPCVGKVKIFAGAFACARPSS